MSDSDGPSPGLQGRSWHWPATLAPYRADLIRMLADSVADDGILGYGTTLTEEGGNAFYDDLERRVTSGDSLVLIGQDGRGTVAMCVAALSSMPNCRHLAEISKAFLDPRVRRSGAVTELVAAVCARMAAEGVETLRIDVREGSPAHRVWTRFGFSTFGILEDYSRIGEVSYRGHFMRHTVRDLSAIVDARVQRGASPDPYSGRTQGKFGMAAQ